MLGYLRFAPLDRDSDAEAGESPRAAFYYLSLLLFLAALLSKTVVCSLPAVLLGR